MQYGNFLGADPCGICPGSHLADASHKAAGTNRAVPLHGETRHSALRADNFGHIHSQGLRDAFTVCARKKAAQPPASATRLSCSPRTIPSRARAAPCWHGSDCVYAFTAGGHSRDRQSNFSVKMLQAVLRGGRASCFHRYAAARRASMLFMPCPVQPATKTSQCPAGSGMLLPWHTAKPPILTTGGLQCCCPA